MKYATVCSGIESPTVAWKPLGWEAQWFSEIEKFPSLVLKHHYPHVPNLGDMTKLNENEIFQQSAIDLLIGGTPCQSFSLAGLREGLADPRGNLMLTFLSLINIKRPRWIAWENVPGVLSSWTDVTESKEGEIWQTNDFDTFLSGLRQLGYGVAWRILDAQYFGVAQRRRRVFVVGYSGDWRCAAAVLFERYSLSGHPAPSRKTKQDIAGTVTAGFARSRGSGLAPEGLVPETVGTLTASYGDYVAGFPEVGAGLFIPTTSHALTTRPYADNASKESQFIPVAYRTSVDGSVYEEGDKTAALTTNTDRSTNIVAFCQNGRDEVREMDVVGALAANPGMKQTSYVRNGKAVRRLLPIECERLQGFSDGYTDIKPRGKATPDGPRYKALGNSIATTVLSWIGKRIQYVDNLLEGGVTA